MFHKLMSIRSRRLTALVLAASCCIASCADDAPDQNALHSAAATTVASTTPAPIQSGESSTMSELTSTVAPTGTVVDVVALDNQYRPQVVTVKVGDEVQWRNGGRNAHDILWIEGDTWGVKLADFKPGDVYSHIFAEPGEYEYYCSVHGNEKAGMTGTVIVTA